MAAKKFLRLVNGLLTEVFGVQTSAGVGNAGDLVSLDDTGRIDATMMPVGIGADTVALPATEALAAGAWVNIYSNAGTASVRNADASGGNAKAADGFVLAAVTNGGTATVYKEGNNGQVSGQTGGSDVYLSATPGVGTHTAPSTSGHVVQRIGKAVGATAVDFERGMVIVLA